MSAGGLTVDTRKPYDDDELPLVQNDMDPDDDLSSGQGFEDDEDEDMASSPSIPDENIDFDQVYALHTFVATIEGQASVVKGDALTLLDDSNSYWWLVRVLKTSEVGYIPAENIETPWERLARLNKHRNVDLTSMQNSVNFPEPPRTLTTPKKNVVISKSISFHAPIILQDDDDDEDMEEDYEEWDEEMEDEEEEDGENGEDSDEYEDQVVPDDDNLLAGQTTHITLTPAIARDSAPPIKRVVDEEIEELMGRRQPQRNGSDSKLEKVVAPAPSSPQHQNHPKHHKVVNVDKGLNQHETYKEKDEKKKIKGFKGLFSRNKKDKKKTTSHLAADNDSRSNSFESRSSDSFDSVRNNSFDGQIKEKEKEKDRLKEKEKEDKDQSSTQLTVLRVFAGNVNLNATFKTCMVNEATTATDLVKQAMSRFHIQEIEGGPNGEENSGIEYFITVKSINDREEYTLACNDKPLAIFQTLTAHLNTPLPSMTHVKRLSSQPTSVQTGTVEVTRVGVTGNGRRVSSESHFGEDSVIKFFLHKKIKRVDEREGKIYIKVSLFSDEVVNGFNGSSLPSPAGKNQKRPIQTKMIAPVINHQERIDKLIAVKPHAVVADVTALALDKFHILNGIADGEDEEEERKRALRLSGDGMGQQERIVKYRLMVMIGGNEQLLFPKDKIVSAFQGTNAPQIRLSNRLSDSGSVTSGSSTASAPHPDEIYFILRRTDRDSDAEWERKQAESRATLESTQQQSAQAGNGQSSLRIDTRAQQQQQQQQQGQRMGSSPVHRPHLSSQLSNADSNHSPRKIGSIDNVRNRLAASSTRTEDLATMGRGLSPDRGNVSARANKDQISGNQERSDRLRMLNSEENISDDSDIGETTTVVSSASRSGAVSSNSRLRTGSVERPPPQEVLSKLDEALGDLEKEKSAAAVTKITGAPSIGNPGAINAVPNEDHGYDITLPGRSGTLRSSRLIDQKVRYSFITPEGKEMEISNIIEDILGDFGVSSSLLDSNPTSPLASLSRNVPPRKHDVSTPGPGLEKPLDVTPPPPQPHLQPQPTNPNLAPTTDTNVSQDYFSIPSKAKAGKINKTDYLESYVDYAKGTDMKPETMARLEKVLRRVKKKEKKEKGDRNTPSPAEMRSKSPADRAKSPSRNARSNDGATVSSTNMAASRSGSADSLRPTISRETTLSPQPQQQQQQQQRQATASPTASVSSVNTTTSDSTKATSLTPSSNVSTPTGGYRGHDSMVFTEDFGLEDMMTLVRSGITFLEAKEKAKNGWDDDVNTSKSASVTSLLQVEANSHLQKGSVREKDVEVRQDVKDVFREPLADLETLDQDLDGLIAEAVRVF